MRRGKLISTHNVADVSIRDMARLMVGREVILQVEKKDAQPGETVLTVENLLVAGMGGVPAVCGVNWSFARVKSSASPVSAATVATDFVEAITGIRPADAGSISLRGKDITHATVRENNGNRAWHMSPKTA